MPSVLLLRARSSCEALCFLLEDEGLEVLHHPALEVAWPEDARALRAAAEGLARFRWVAPDAPAAARALVEAAAQAGTRRVLGAVRWLVPDARTAHLVEGAGWLPQLVEQAPSCAVPGHVHPSTAWRAVAQGLVETDDEVLVLHEAQGPPAWAAELSEGRGRVVTVRAWQARPLPPVDRTPDVVLVDSSAGAEVLLDHEVLRSARLVASGPGPAQRLRALGLAVTRVAAAPTPEALCEAAVAAAAPP